MSVSRMETRSDRGSEQGNDSGCESNHTDSGDQVYIRISVVDMKLQKCLQFQPEDTVWTAKQRVLATLARDLRDGLNYGLYCPPMNGKAGKFLDEERPLKEYPLPGPIGFLEFKYKRRVYKLMQVNPRKLRQLHTKANLKQFVDMVRKNDVDKISKMLNKGLDPNFHETDSGECPLTIAASIEKMRSMLMMLIAGGAHVDFRNKAGLTGLHKAAQKGNLEAVKTFLDLGASPNYKDGHGLTPLYHAVCHDTSPACVEHLLHDHAVLGIQDDRGWTECHHACKAGRVQHLEHLLFYGADMNLRNASGNTPLHVCAANDQESCCRNLLFRGADKTVHNYANQDAYQVAIISNNPELAEIIRGFDAKDIVPFQELPKYNEKRRGTMTAATLSKLQRSRSDPRLNILGAHSTNTIHVTNPSNNATPNFISNGLFDPPRSAHASPSRDYDSDSLQSSGGSFSGSYDYGSEYSPGPMTRSASCDLLAYVPASMTLPRTHSRHSMMESVRVAPPSPLSIQYHVPDLSQRVFVCTNNYCPQDDDEINIYKGDLVEVLHMGDQGFWQGKVDNHIGWFPSDCVQEVYMRRKGHFPSEDRATIIQQDTMAAISKANGDGGQRTVRLHKGKNGFGFVLRGAKSQLAHTSSLEFVPTPDFPALQYLDRVDKGSMADQAGLKPGDFVLEINSESVIKATHEHTVQLIKTSGNILTMNVMTVKPLSQEALDQRGIHADGTRTLPHKKNRADAPAPPHRNPHTSLSGPKGQQASTTRASLIELEGSTSDEDDFCSPLDLEKLDMFLEDSDDAQAVSRGINPNNKTASIVRPTKHMSSVPLDVIFSRSDEPDTDYANQYDLAQRRQQLAQHITQVSVDADPAPSRVQHNEKEPLYAVPSKPESGRQRVPQSGDSPPPPPGKSIPPPPGHPAPAPSAGVIRISTHPQYANVSADVHKQKAAGNAGSDFESSFRPESKAYLSKDPINIPGGMRASHSRSSSNTSSLSSMSEPTGSRGSQHSSEHYHTPNVSTTRTLAGASAHINREQEKKVYEPVPDYDSGAPGVGGSSPSKKTDTSYSPNRPAFEESEPKSTAFGNAIRLAAIEREKRAKNGEAKKQVGSTVTQKATSKSAPPPPPPPPVSGGAIPPPPSSAPPIPPTAESEPRKSPLPPHVQKQLEASKKQEDTHAALMKAVAQRRNIVESADMNNMATNIESRVQRSKKLQTTVYKSDQTKVDVTPKPVITTTVQKTVQPSPTSGRMEFKAKVAPPPPVKTAKKKEEEEEEERKKKEQEKKENKEDGNNNQDGLKQNGSAFRGPPNSDDSRRTSTASETNFTLMAERARQEFLEKRAAATLDRNKGKGGGTSSGAPTTKLNAGGFAQEIAKKAELINVKPNGSNNNKSNGVVNGASSQRVNGAPPSPSTDWSERTVEIHGATVDYSNTDTPKISRSPSFSKPEDDNTSSSVADKRLMFEKSKALSGKGTRIEDIPQMVPPPAGFSHLNGHTPNGYGNGHPINGIGRNSQDILRGKLSQTRTDGGVHLSNGSVHSNGVAHTVMVPDFAEPDMDMDISVIPPPPVFDMDRHNKVFNPFLPQADDTVSMVSSVSTLSTLSSADHEMYSYDSPLHSSPPGPMVQPRSGHYDINPPEEFGGVPPPPPGFDDDKSSAVEPEYIPPPMGFDSPTNTSLRSVMKPQTNSKNFPACTTAKPTRPAFQNKPIETWSMGDVGQWLESLQLGQYRNTFARNTINGQKLIQMGRNELIELKVTDVGHRMTIERAISRARVHKS